MLKSPLYSNELSLSAQAKAIPYASDCLVGPDSVTNYGFKNLKIKPSLIETIPELENDASLRALVTTLNACESSFFTAGCDSKLHCTSAGYYRQGYIEIAWNCTQCVQDAINYFALYFHFNKSLLVQGFNQPVQLKWNIQEVTFSAVEVHGFSCSIQVKTRSLSSAEAANQAWQLSLRMIQSYLETVETNRSSPIYTPLFGCSSER